MLVGDIVRRNAAYFGANDAVVIPGGESYSWTALEQRSNALARAFRSLGLRKGDSVATLMGNRVDFYDFFFACAKTGVIGAPTNTRLAPAELASYLACIEPAAIVVAAELAEKAQAFVGELPSLSHVIGVGGGHPFRLDLDELRAAEEGSDPGCRVRGDDAYQLAATSGTTGIPKGAITTLRGAMTGITTHAIELGVREGGTNLQVIPMFFNPGGPSGIHQVFLRGGRSVLIEPFDPGLFLAAIERYRGTHAIAVPTMVTMLLDHPDCGKHDYSSLEGIASGGSPLPLTLVERARAAFGDVLVPLYGMAETCSCGLALRRESQMQGGVSRLRSAGKPTAQMQLRVVDDEGVEVPHDGETSGEIWMRGDSVSPGYYRMPEETAASRDGDWFKSGDIATIDREGFVTIVDRRKDIIITGGINVFSQEIEKAVQQHPAVALSAAIGVPHPTWGEAIHLVVQLRDGASADVDELIAFASERLADFKKPRSLDIVAAMPLSATGKILKKELRERYATAV